MIHDGGWDDTSQSLSKCHPFKYVPTIIPLKCLFLLDTFMALIIHIILLILLEMNCSSVSVFFLHLFHGEFNTIFQMSIISITGNNIPIITLALYTLSFIKLNPQLSQTFLTLQHVMFL